MKALDTIKVLGGLMLIFPVKSVSAQSYLRQSCYTAAAPAIRDPYGSLAANQWLSFCQASIYPSKEYGKTYYASCVERTHASYQEKIGFCGNFQ